MENLPATIDAYHVEPSLKNLRRRGWKINISAAPFGHHNVRRNMTDKNAKPHRHSHEGDMFLLAQELIHNTALCSLIENLKLMRPGLNFSRTPFSNHQIVQEPCHPRIVWGHVLRSMSASRRHRKSCRKVPHHVTAK
jgi:hypothetical protein